ncbi:MAG: cyclic nucleotide-binding domain-containing protein [Actinomycetia bacterium]|nr:cyclic nucleotide-binding domain-containing protein [Actinomycetes bacterium]
MVRRPGRSRDPSKERADAWSASVLRSIGLAWDRARAAGPGQAFYPVLGGLVAIEPDGSELGAFGPGDFFGEMSLLDSAPRASGRRRWRSSCSRS